MNINIEEFREVVGLAREMERIADKITPFLELMADVSVNGAILTPSDRYIPRGDVRKILHVGSGQINKLIKAGKLTPFYVGDSREQKFRLGEVLKIPQPKTGKKLTKEDVLNWAKTSLPTLFRSMKDVEEALRKSK